MSLKISIYLIMKVDLKIIIYLIIVIDLKIRIILIIIILIIIIIITIKIKKQYILKVIEQNIWIKIIIMDSMI